MQPRLLHRALRGRKPQVLLSGALVSLAGYLALAVLAAQQHVFVLDHGVQDAFTVLQWESLRLPMVLVSMLGDNLGLLLLIGIAFLLLWRVNRRWAIALPVLMAGAGALQWIAKRASHRPRPNLALWGFPSGHVLSLVVFFGLMIYLITIASKRRRRWRILACLACAATVVAVGVSRLYLGVHWVSDLAGGFAVGTAYLLLAIWFVEIVCVRPPPGAPPGAGEEGT